MKKFIKIMTGFMNRMTQDHVSAFAAQAAFFILMSFVPFLIASASVGNVCLYYKRYGSGVFFCRFMPDVGRFSKFSF